MRFHIDDLEIALYHNHWRILERIKGNERDVSEYWLMTHLYFLDKTITLVFEGLDDCQVLLVEQSYACHVLENKKIDLYFSKHNKDNWQKSLMTFINQILEYMQSP